MASRVTSQNMATRGSNRGALSFMGETIPGSMGESAARQGSPYTSFSPLPKAASSALWMRFISSTVKRPIRSKRKPSIWYSFAQYSTECTI